VSSLGRSIRKSCLLVGLTRASYDYQQVVRNDDKLRERIRELANQRDVSAVSGFISCCVEKGW